ncbi:MAG TPA: hypothetical protein PLG56_12685 [Lacunisphaera sp.]|nr:hypothetical protein [Lacunisphaera sp.]
MNHYSLAQLVLSALGGIALAIVIPRLAPRRRLAEDVIELLDKSGMLTNRISGEVQRQLQHIAPPKKRK